jgi:isocitrate lyase
MNRPEPSFRPPSWSPNRWHDTRRDFTPHDVARLSGSLPIEYTLAEEGARKLWHLLHTEDFVPTLGTYTGNQAVQQVKAGVMAIYLSGWQVAADANSSGNMYPDQSLYPADSVPAVVARINRALQRADQIQTMERLDGKTTEDIDYLVPIVADAEAGFGGPLNAFELMKAMIEAGAAAVHFEDQLASEKKCGHLGGKVLVPTATPLDPMKTSFSFRSSIDSTPESLRTMRTRRLGTAMPSQLISAASYCTPSGLMCCAITMAWSGTSSDVPSRAITLKKWFVARMPPPPGMNSSRISGLPGMYCGRCSEM